MRNKLLAIGRASPIGLHVTGTSETKAHKEMSRSADIAHAVTNLYQCLYYASPGACMRATFTTEIT